MSDNTASAAKRLCTDKSIKELFSCIICKKTTKKLPKSQFLTLTVNKKREFEEFLEVTYEDSQNKICKQDYRSITAKIHSKNNKVRNLLY